MNELRSYYFNMNASASDKELLRQRIILDSDIYFVYNTEKWIEHHAAISEKDIYYHRLVFVKIFLNSSKNLTKFPR